MGRFVYEVRVTDTLRGQSIKFTKSNDVAVWVAQDLEAAAKEVRTWAPPAAQEPGPREVDSRTVEMKVTDMIWEAFFPRPKSHEWELACNLAADIDRLYRPRRRAAAPEGDAP